MTIKEIKSNIYEIVKTSDYYTLNQSCTRGIIKVYMKDHSNNKAIVRKGLWYSPSNFGFIYVQLEGKKVMLSDISTGDKWTIKQQFYKDHITSEEKSFFIAKGV